ncbi:hypothetical protein G4O51_03625 [Candidatus Bathyarchaeota archaeon A05DMB-2]|nr:hypothetical protein [Candidatus Bathyarchaeota archaeon A05DMB-2]
MSKHVLLVEPRYYTRYPPLGLLKLSSYHKKIGDTTELVRGTTTHVSREPNIIYVTSLFTWAWKPVWEAVRFYSILFPKADLWLGGLYASLMPEHATLSGVNPKRIFKGIFTEAEDLCPDYSLVPDWNKKVSASIIFSSRGCIRSCTFCAVPRIEGKMKAEKSSIRHLIWPGHKRVILFDNNFLASSKWESVLKEIEELDLRVDFNQGLDARLISDRVAKKISRVKIDRFVRLSYDYIGMGSYVRKAINLLKSNGIDGRNILVYALYNFTDSPQDLFTRIKNTLSWGAVSYPMRYQPTNTLSKNTYVAPKWDEIRLNAVQRARRVIGSGGAFPPYEGMLKVKVEKCHTFDEAFNEFMKPLEVIQ